MELKDGLGKRIAEAAPKIKTLKSAIEQQNTEVLRIRGEHSRIVCRAAATKHPQTPLPDSWPARENDPLQ
ncbi:hypothetical protein ACDW_13580 [Acidovorax sp. DW039]|uniref:hypothetical protein n=1 Tax=Acidovorax sp. DW039 TaxID=3095606 RepID=UPI00308A6CDE|nr:hypothetical protein ACDW_13580 [Acidovorax sp. DW039]